MSTARELAATLRSAIKDSNFWFQSEADSPLRISRSGNPTIDEDRIKSLDASLRRPMVAGGYVLPDRDIATVTVQTIEEVFNPQIDAVVANFNAYYPGIAAGSVTYEQFEGIAESLEYYVQLRNAFAMMTSPQICKVDYPDDPYVGLVIIGTAEGVDSTGNPRTEAVMARALLVQT
jgi:hypothetical protein